jgi:hypothetical protein
LERRIKHLETLVAQQGYILHVGMIVVIFDTAGLLWLWQDHGKPDFDHIAVAMTVFQTLFGIAALYGFWALRGLTKEKAEEVAQDVAEAEIRKIAPSLVLRVATDTLKTLNREAAIPTSDNVNLTDAMGKETSDGQ